jgi:hypothetical protein
LPQGLPLESHAYDDGYVDFKGKNQRNCRLSPHELHRMRLLRLCLPRQKAVGAVAEVGKKTVKGTENLKDLGIK